MAWSLSPVFPGTPAYVEQALSVAGRALYLANAYESKCRFVLQIAELDAYVERVPNASFAEALAAASGQKLLGPIIARLSAVAGLDSDVTRILDEAKSARNFIAHEGAAFGYVHGTRPAAVQSHLERLRHQLRRLVPGDDLVSRWVYQIEEKEPPPTSPSHAYPALVETWVFYPVESAA